MKNKIVAAAVVRRRGTPTPAPMPAAAPLDTPFSDADPAAPVRLAVGTCVSVRVDVIVLAALVIVAVGVL